jgi:hypothetical protein
MVINVFIILCCLVTFSLYTAYSENRHPLPSFILIFIVISQLSMPLDWYIKDVMAIADFQAAYKTYGWPSFAIYFGDGYYMGKLDLWQWIFSLILTYIIVIRKKVY